MNRLFWLGVSSILLPAVAAAQASRNYECTNGGETRRVEVAYPSGGAVPCEVRYYKGAVPEVLWSAGNEVGFCADRAAEFVVRLQGMGWTCTDRGSAAAAASRDDTEVLGAGAARP
jgi:hypothetical protein